MEVKLVPARSGCLIAILTVVTWGLYPLLRRLGERHFIRHMDDEGVETRSGKRIGWGEFTSCRRVALKTGAGVRMSDECLLRSPKGTVSLPLWRAEDPAGALSYLTERVPPGIQAGR